MAPNISKIMATAFHTDAHSIKNTAGNCLSNESCKINTT